MKEVITHPVEFRVPPTGIPALAPLQFATNADKLAATDITPGTEAVITGEANRLEKYIGDTGVDEDNTPLLFTQAGYDEDVLAPNPQISEFSGVHNGRPVWNVYLRGNISCQIRYANPGWEVRAENLATLYTNPDDVEYPWQITSPWVEGPDNTGDDLPPVFVKHPAGSNTNWEIIGANTFELVIEHVYDDDPAGITINNVVIPDANTTISVGWCREGAEIPVAVSGEDIVLGLTAVPAHWEIDGQEISRIVATGDNTAVQVGLGLSSLNSILSSFVSGAPSPHLAGWGASSFPAGWVKFGATPRRGMIKTKIWSGFS